MGGNFVVIHHAVNAGEVSPRYTGRQDQNKYLAACETLENFLPLVLGGAYVRCGTQFVIETKFVADHPEKRLIDFVASRTAAYAIEAGHEYMRFFFNGEPLNEIPVAIVTTTNTTPVIVFAPAHGFVNGDSVFIDGTGIDSLDNRYWTVANAALNTFELSGSTAPGTVAVAGTAARRVEVVTPYDSAHLGQLMYVQSVDVMYLLHRFYPVHKLVRTTQNTFVINEVNFDPPATIEEEPTGANLGFGTLTLAATTGNAVTATTSGSGWLPGDIGRLIVSGAGRATIKSIISGTQVSVDIIDDFASVGPIAATDWRLRLSPQAQLDIAPAIKDVGQVVTLFSPGYSVAMFRSSDLGKFISIYGGSGKIIQVLDATQVNILIRATLKDVVSDDPAPTRAWSLEVPAWSATLGHPSCGCFFEERLWLCKGLTINGSRSGDYENFARGANADDAIQRTLSDDDVDVIVWIKGYKTLKVATGSGIFEITATAQNGALTPSSFKASPIDPNGSARIAPLRVGSSLIHVQDGQREILELSYNFSDDAFKSPKLLRLADHLNDGYFFTEIHRATQPDSFIFAVRNDGTLCACIYEAQESVIGWSRIVTQGEIKTMCVIPRGSSGKDWWWAIVERDNGVFVEFFEPDHGRSGREWNDLHTDSAVLAQPDTNFVVSGLDHLEGQTVWVIGDGMLFNAELDANLEVQSTAVVTGGQITLDPPLTVAVAEVGLGYDATLVPVEPVVTSEAGGPFIARYYADIGIRIRRALGLRLRAYQVNINEPSESTWLGEQLVYRKPYVPMDQQVPLQRGKKCIINMGADPFARIEIKQLLPFPAEVMNVVGNLHVGDRWMCDTYPDAEVFFTPIEPFPPPPPACPDPTPSAQDLPVVCCYDSNGFGDLTGNDAGEMNYVAPDGSFWHTASLQSGLASPYPVDTPQKWYLLQGTAAACSLTDITDDAIPLGARTANFSATQTAQAGINGKSDEKSYFVVLTNINPDLNIGGTPWNDSWFYAGQVSGGHFFNHSSNFGIGRVWCKRGSKFYTVAQSFGQPTAFVAYDMPSPNGSYEVLSQNLSGVISGWNDAVHSHQLIAAVQASANYLWVLIGAMAGVSTLPRLYRFDITDFSFVDFIELSDANFDTTFQFHVHSESMVFLLADKQSVDSTWRIGYVIPASSVFVLIDSVPLQCTQVASPSGFFHQGFHYSAGYFYLTSGGSGTGVTNVLKLGPLVCPSDPELIWGG